MYSGFNFVLIRHVIMSTLKKHYGVQRQRCATEWHSKWMNPVCALTFQHYPPMGEFLVIFPATWLINTPISVLLAKWFICCLFGDTWKTSKTLCVHLFSLMYSLSRHVYYVWNWWYIKPYCFLVKCKRFNHFRVYRNWQYRVHSIKNYFKVKSFVNQTNCRLKLISRRQWTNIH